MSKKQHTVVNQQDVERAVRKASNNVWRQYNRDSSLSQEDLFQEGMLAACEVMNKFDDSMGVSVTTYLWRRIHTEVKRYASRQVKASGMLQLDAELTDRGYNSPEHQLQEYPQHCAQEDPEWIYDRKQFRGHVSLFVDNEIEKKIDIEEMLQKISVTDQMLLTDRFVYGITLAKLAKKYNMTVITLRRHLKHLTGWLKGYYNARR
jgi:RNA polymerase sigma factor (sigma-70 family)